MGKLRLGGWLQITQEVRGGASFGPRAYLFHYLTQWFLRPQYANPICSQESKSQKSQSNSGPFYSPHSILSTSHLSSSYFYPRYSWVAWILDSSKRGAGTKSPHLIFSSFLGPGDMNYSWSTELNISPLGWWLLTSYWNNLPKVPIYRVVIWISKAWSNPRVTLECHLFHRHLLNASNVLDVALAGGPERMSSSLAEEGGI